MARASERDRYRYGVCTNRDKDGKPCPKCESKEVQKMRMGQDLVCEECKESLRQVPPPRQSAPLGKIIGIVVAAVIIIGGGAAAYFIMGKSNPKPILVTSVSLSKTSITLDEGETNSLEVIILPSDAENTTTTWYSSDPTVATVDDGNITALSAGSTTIKVEVQDGSLLSASCEVVVKSLVQEPEEPVVEESENQKQPKESSAAPSTTTNATVAVTGGRYTGQLKGGKPHGQGTLVYSSRSRISKRDMKERYAEAKQYIIGEFHEGELVHGTLYDANNDPIEQIRVGR